MAKFPSGRGAESVRRLAAIARKYPALRAFRSGAARIGDLQRKLDELSPDSPARKALADFLDWLEAPLKEAMAKFKRPPPDPALLARLRRLV